MADEKKVVSKVTLMCGGRRCCPEVTAYDDGSMTIEDHDDGNNAVIQLSAEQASALKKLI